MKEITVKVNKDSSGPIQVWSKDKKHAFAVDLSCPVWILLRTSRCVRRSGSGHEQ
jgi:hypothetical protein